MQTGPVTPFIPAQRRPDSPTPAQLRRDVETLVGQIEHSEHLADGYAAQGDSHTRDYWRGVADAYRCCAERTRRVLGNRSGGMSGRHLLCLRELFLAMAREVNKDASKAGHAYQICRRLRPHGDSAAMFDRLRKAAADFTLFASGPEGERAYLVREGIRVDDASREDYFAILEDAQSAALDDLLHEAEQDAGAA